MDLNDLNYIPDWREESLSEDEGEAWKTLELRAAGKALYTKWREIFGLIIGIIGDPSEMAEASSPETHEMCTRKFIYENAMVIAPKIRSASLVNMYILQMENASIIRTNCIQLMEQIGFGVLSGFIERNYKEIIDEEMIQFRELFKNWIATFKRDDIEDEWGLFI